tara:strand:+ start:463 stop:618 length:156 start_codon:yes stop_codon:yes gene_type:complete
MPYRIRKEKDKDGKVQYCAYKVGADSPKACSKSEKSIRLYIAFAKKKSGEK